MWTIPDVYTRIPQVKIEDYRWYVISFRTFQKLKHIDSIILSYDTANILWIPCHNEFKRLQSQSNQVITIDRPNYPNYGFLAIYPDVTDIQLLRSEINSTFFAEVLSGPVFTHEMRKVFEEAHKIAAKAKKPNFEIGSYVLLTSGAFYGMRAQVVKVDGAKVYLEIFMGQNAIQIVTNIMDIVKDDTNTIE